MPRVALRLGWYTAGGFLTVALSVLMPSGPAGATPPAPPSPVLGIVTDAAVELLSHPVVRTPIPLPVLPGLPGLPELTAPPPSRPATRSPAVAPSVPGSAGVPAAVAPSGPGSAPARVGQPGAAPIATGNRVGLEKAPAAPVDGPRPFAPLAVAAALAGATGMTGRGGGPHQTPAAISTGYGIARAPTVAPAPTTAVRLMVAEPRPPPTRPD